MCWQQLIVLSAWWGKQFNPSHLCVAKIGLKKGEVIRLLWHKIKAEISLQDVPHSQEDSFPLRLWPEFGEQGQIPQVTGAEFCSVLLRRGLMALKLPILSLQPSLC